MKFQLNLSYLGYNTVLRTLEIRHYGPVCDVSETGLYKLKETSFSRQADFGHFEVINFYRGQIEHMFIRCEHIMRLQ